LPPVGGQPARRLSAAIARAERIALAGLAGAIFLLIALNVVTRTAGRAVYWVDEAAIYAMIWMTMVGFSHAVHDRSWIAVTLVPDMLGEKGRERLATAVDAVLLLSSALLIYLSWIWYDLPGIVGADFDRLKFQGETFNFIYSEPTNTLGISKAWVWLVMPLTACTMCVHSAANLLERKPAPKAPPG